MRLLVPFLRPYRGRAIASGIVLALAAMLVLGLGQGVRQLVDQGFAAGDAAHLNRAALVMAGVVAVNRKEEWVMAEKQQRVFEKVVERLLDNCFQAQQAFHS